jgi:EAL domain-containing protein (putative c-di-GMP-specific phosphodiesterase class I)
MADPHRVLRRRRGPLQLALGGVLVALVLAVEVEAEQAASLVALGCQDGQGFHFSRP